MMTCRYALRLQLPAELSLLLNDRFDVFMELSRLGTRLRRVSTSTVLDGVL